MENMRLDDNSDYPRTIDPTRIYKPEDKILSQTIVDRKSISFSRAVGAEPMIDVHILYPHFPMERTCPLLHTEKYKNHDKFVTVKLTSGRLYYMQEYMYRLYEYFYYQILGALSDSNPYGRTRA